MKGRWVCIGITAVVCMLLVAMVVHVYIRAHGTGSSDAERVAAVKAAHQVQATIHGKFCGDL